MKLSVLGCWGVGTVGETTSFLLDIAESTVMIDVGGAPARQMYLLGRVLPEVSHIFISHVHADHLQGLPYALFARGVQERTFGKVPPIKVVSHPEVIAAAKQLCSLLYPERPLTADWIEIETGETLDLGHGVVVRSLAVDHTVPCFAYRFEGENKALTFSADTLLTENLIEFAKGSTVMIQEAFGTEQDFSGISAQLKHSLALHAGQIGNRAGVENLVLYHMHERYFKEEKRQELITEVQKNYSGNIIFPQDLNVLNF